MGSSEYVEWFKDKADHLIGFPQLSWTVFMKILLHGGDFTESQDSSRKLWNITKITIKIEL